MVGDRIQGYGINSPEVPPTCRVDWYPRSKDLIMIRHGYSMTASPFVLNSYPVRQEPSPKSHSPVGGWEKGRYHSDGDEVHVS